ncbi:hypothetical protein QO010_004626 [Caulobacter ginsengisoli]|uniref:DUF202 domain-containing protein n=1 Tax=Caulobacter ginsengisoli TaxID=400775 RepID=A0ABU0IZP9_9CAUL|nr:hypothetical protein [Caulobacter ginsengisoli]MDQ0466830.1 hypothetical protein [Caulobacter ginsengisoli]
MPPPDLSTPEGRAAYAKELGQVARPLRWGGLGAIGLSAIGVWWVRSQDIPVLHSAPGLAFVGLMLAGWVLIGFAIAQRTAYHRRRLSEK